MLECLLGESPRRGKRLRGGGKGAGCSRRLSRVGGERENNKHKRGGEDEIEISERKSNAHKATVTGGKFQLIARKRFQQKQKKEKEKP